MAVVADIAGSKEFIDSRGPGGRSHSRWVRWVFSPKEKMLLSLGMSLVGALLLIEPYPLPAAAAVALSMFLSPQGLGGGP